jgi:hypothetical protein
LPGFKKTFPVNRHRQPKFSIVFISRSGGGGSAFLSLLFKEIRFVGRDPARLILVETTFGLSSRFG